MEGYNFHHSRYYQSLLKNKFPPSVSSIKALSYSGSTRQLHCLNACSTQARVRGRLRVGERLYHLLGVLANVSRLKPSHFVSSPRAGEQGRSGAQGRWSTIHSHTIGYLSIAKVSFSILSKVFNGFLFYSGRGVRQKPA